jgi:hypothetical protein
LTFTPLDGHWVTVSAPADVAIDGVIWIAVFALTVIPAYLLMAELLAEWHPDEPPLRMRTPGQSPSA